MKQTIEALPVTILVVDDARVNQKLLARMLSLAGYQVQTASSGSQALDAVQSCLPDLILLDVWMADIDGYAVCQQLKADPATSDIPVIFISAASEIDDKVKGFAAGGVDYITKPFRAEEVIARIENQLRLCQLQQQLVDQNAQLQQEIQERQRIEANLRRSEQRLRLITDSLPGCISYVDADQRYQFVNKTYEDWFGRSWSELIDRPIRTVIGEEAYSEVCAYVERVLAGEPVTYEAEVPYQTGGTRFIHATLVPDREEDANVRGYYALITDISDRKKTEQDLHQAKETAERASVAKSEFSANMSHELRTPLNAILGFAQVMRQDTSLSAEHQSHLEIIYRSGQHLLELVNSVLDMTRLEAGQTGLHEAPCDLYDLLYRLEEMLGLKAAAKGLDLRFDCAAEVPRWIAVDSAKLRQVLLSLLSNAIKFTAVGTVTLRVARIAVDRREDPVDPDGSSDRDVTLQFEVTDTGVGIPAEEMHLLFQSFSQTQIGQQLQEGAGLGLAISQQFVKLMGGQLRVESTVGSGSTFRFAIQVRCISATASVTQPTEPPRDRQSAFKTLLKGEDLADLPRDWLEALHRAVSNCCDREVFRLLQQMPSSHATLAASLFELANSFRFDKIMSLTEAAMRTQPQAMPIRSYTDSAAT